MTMAIPTPPPGFTEDVEMPTPASPERPRQNIPAAPEGFTEDLDPTQQSYVQGLLRVGLGQGAAFGFGDEIAAGIRALTGESYSDAVKDERAKVEAFRKQNPKAALAAEIGGSFLTPGVGVAGGAVKTAATAGGRILQGAKVGAGFGLLGAAGSSEFAGNNRSFADNATDLAKNAAIGTTVGTVLGGALPAVGTVAGGLIERARDAISPSVARKQGGVEAAADQVIANRLKRAGKTEADIAADLAGGRNAAQLPKSTALLPEAIIDADPTLQRLGGSVYRSGGQGANEVEAFIASRQGGEPEKGLFGRASARAVPQNQYERLNDDMARALGVKSKTPGKELTTIRNEQRVLGNEDYRNAWAKQEEFDLSNALVGWELIRRNEVGTAEQAALSKALKMFTRPDANDSRMMKLYEASDRLDDLVSKAVQTGKMDLAEKLQRRAEIVNKQLEEAHVRIGSAPFPINNLERFDKAKRSLDGMISEAKNDNVKRLLRNLKNDLLDVAHGGDRTNPTKNIAYSEARDAWGSREALLDAAEMGRNYMLGKGNITAEDFRGLSSNAEKSMFRLFALEALKGQSGGKALGPTTDFTRELYKPNVYSKLREIIPQGDTSEKLGELVRREGRISATAKEVLGNSKTAQRTQDDLDYAGRDLLGAAWSTFRSNGGVINLGLDAVKVGFERAFGFKDDMAKALAARLIELDPVKQQVLLTRIGQRMGPDKVDKFLAFMDKARLASTAATAGEIGSSVSGMRKHPGAN